MKADENVIVALGVILLPVLVAIKLYWSALTNELVTQVGATDMAVPTWTNTRKTSSKTNIQIIISLQPEYILYNHHHIIGSRSNLATSWRQCFIYIYGIVNGVVILWVLFVLMEIVIYLGIIIKGVDVCYICILL